MPNVRIGYLDSKPSVGEYELFFFPCRIKCALIHDDVINRGGGWGLMTSDDEGGRGGSKMAKILMT
jgi:hypothetical protein